MVITLGDCENLLNGNSVENRNNCNNNHNTDSFYDGM